METVEVVIRLRKERYDELQKNKHLPNRLDIEKAITDGTVLQKGHGRLIDADKYKFDNEDAFCICFGGDAMNVFKRSVDNTPTVIEADRGDDNG